MTISPTRSSRRQLRRSSRTTTEEKERELILGDDDARAQIAHLQSQLQEERDLRRAQVESAATEHAEMQAKLDQAATERAELQARLDSVAGKLDRVLSWLPEADVIAAVYSRGSADALRKADTPAQVPRPRRDRSHLRALGIAGIAALAWDLARSHGKAVALAAVTTASVGAAAGVTYIVAPSITSTPPPQSPSASSPVTDDPDALAPLTAPFTAPSHPSGHRPPQKTVHKVTPPKATPSVSPSASASPTVTSPSPSVTPTATVTSTPPPVTTTPPPSTSPPPGNGGGNGHGGGNGNGGGGGKGGGGQGGTTPPPVTPPPVPVPPPATHQNGLIGTVLGLVGNLLGAL